MFKILIVSITLGILQISCSNTTQKDVRGLWFYVSNPNTPDENANPEGFLYLQTDSSYTRDFGKFDFGKWAIKNLELLLTSSQGLSVSFPIKHNSEKNLHMLSANGTLLKFEQQPANFISKDVDPFSIENNQWRVPANRKENDLEIRSRLRNHFRFHVVYFRWALDAGFSNIDVRSTPSPIKIYGNGFTLKEFKDLPDAWRSYFYDKEDCQKANDMIKAVFNNDNIIWENTDNRFKMFISAFQQLEQKINQ